MFEAEIGRSAGAVLRPRSSLRQCEDDPEAMTESIASADPPGSAVADRYDAAVLPAPSGGVALGEPARP
ncbi:MAG TPA: hypothetical protein VFP27_07935, partial [Mycobacterium sp.]|nr:hypothetical protein [Mycobacterium sp.]